MGLFQHECVEPMGSLISVEGLENAILELDSVIDRVNKTANARSKLFFIFLI